MAMVASSLVVGRYVLIAGPMSIGVVPFHAVYRLITSVAIGPVSAPHIWRS